MIINIILSLTMRLLYLFTCFVHPQPVTGPPFVREATCIMSLHSVHLCIEYAIQLSFLVRFILASRSSCLCICVLHASYHDSSQLQSLLMHPSSCGPTDPFPLQKNACLFKPTPSSILPNPLSEQIKFRYTAFSYHDGISVKLSNCSNIPIRTGIRWLNLSVFKHPGSHRSPAIKAPQLLAIVQS